MKWQTSLRLSIVNFIHSLSMKKNDVSAENFHKWLANHQQWFITSKCLIVFGVHSVGPTQIFQLFADILSWIVCIWFDEDSNRKEEDALRDPFVWMLLRQHQRCYWCRRNHGMVTVL